MWNSWPQAGNISREYWRTLSKTTCLPREKGRITSYQTLHTAGKKNMEKQGHYLRCIPQALSGMRVRRNRETGPSLAEYPTSSQLSHMLHLLKRVFCWSGLDWPSNRVSQYTVWEEIEKRGRYLLCILYAPSYMIFDWLIDSIVEE